MKKYTLTAPGRIEAQECQKPQPGESEALIRVKYVGICGSDIHLFKGSYNGPHSYPMLFGHEWSGVVEAIGSKVKNVRPGDMVTGDCSRYCGVCPNCQTNRNLCSTIEKFGITIDGASAEYICRDARYVYKAPAGSDMKLLALTEPISVAAMMITRIKTVIPELADKKVLILGGGTIGTAALYCLTRREKCRSVDLYDITASRCEIAKKLGARIPDPSEINVKVGEDYASLYSAAKYDVVIETTGVPAVFANSLYLLKPAGVLGCIGMIGSVEIAEKLIVTKSLTVMGSIGGTGEFENTMELMGTSKASAELLISHTFPIDRMEEAFERCRNVEGTMKIMLQL